jgi:hypothetical protein
MNIINKNSVVKYYNTNFLNVNVNGKNVVGGVSAWQGIRKLTDTNLINVGTTNPNPQTGQGFIYIGNIQCNSGDSYYLSVPNYKYTSIYGPDYDDDTGLFTFVGSCSNNSNNNSNNKTDGFIYKGTLNNLNKKKYYSFPSVNKKYDTTFIHSNMNGYLVGNTGNVNKQKIRSFIYNINDLNNYTRIKFPGSLTTTTYGIWYNGGTSYTITGGYSMKTSISIDKLYKNGLPTVYPFENGFIADFDSFTKKFSNWTTIDYKKIGFSIEHPLHIEGISGLNNNPNTYSLSAQVLIDAKPQGYYLSIIRNKNTFDIINGVNIKYSDGITTANSVVDNKIVGININKNKTISYQSEIIFNDNLSGSAISNQTIIYKNQNVIFNKQFIDGNISASKTGMFTFKNEGLYNINFSIYLKNLNLPAAIFTVYYTVNGKPSNFIIEQKGIDDFGTGTAHGLAIPCIFSNKFFPNDTLFIQNSSDGDIILVSDYNSNSVGALISINQISTL